jgi:hypothetical protein
MTWTLSYCDDRCDPGAVAALPGSHRILYVLEGSVVVGRKALNRDDAAYLSDAAEIRAGANGARVFRWELAGEAAAPLAAPGVHSMLRMAEPVWSLDLQPGSRWVFRLDRIDNPPGVVADVHTHPGPGIRALLAGTFHVRQPSEDGAAERPGDPWWESGVEAVISTPSATETSSFLRCMLLPVEYLGRPDTARWLRTKPAAKAGWRLYVDEIVTL